MIETETVTAIGPTGAERAAERVRTIAIYLPQFHPIPENDAWWGKGFTEWTNVAKARPLFRGHVQPRLPTAFGYYDLRVPETRHEQAAAARRHGIDGFCYYHYWFNGRRLLERPFNEVLSSGEPDFPFCLCWANETWSRRWLGEERDVLIQQDYSEEDDLAHARWLCRAFADERYVRVHGRPVFLVYRPKHLDDPRRTTDTLRREVERHGLPEPWLVGVDAHCPRSDCRDFGFDATMGFEPALGVLPQLRIEGFRLKRARRNWRLGVKSGRLRVFDDQAARAWMQKYIVRHFPYYPSVFVGWDNSPRRGKNGYMIVNGTPERFGEYLLAAMRKSYSDFGNDGLVFINAWNEWAEGNYLEPDALHGWSYLEAARTAAERFQSEVAVSAVCGTAGANGAVSVGGAVDAD